MCTIKSCLVIAPPTLHGEDRSKYILKAGDTNAFLTCSGSGDPQPEVSWVRLKDMIQLPSDNLTNYVRLNSMVVKKEVEERVEGWGRGGMKTGSFL